MPAPGGLTRSLGRAISLLDVLASNREMALSDLARAAGLPKATVYRQLLTLKGEGLTVFDPKTERYRLGPRILRWAEKMVTTDVLRLVSRPVVEHLSRESDESAGLVERVGTDSVCVMAVHSPHELRVAVRVGMLRPLTIGAPSRALLAHYPEHEIRQILTMLKVSGSKTTALNEELRLTKTRGFGRSLSESLQGVYSIGVPIFDLRGRPRAALAIYAPEARASLSREKRWFAQLKKASAEICQLMAGTSHGDLDSMTPR